MADEDKRAESQDQAHQTTRSEDKRHFEGNMTKLIQDVKALSEEKKTELYRQLVKKSLRQKILMTHLETKPNGVSSG